MRGGAIAIVLIALGTALALWLLRPVPAPQAPPTETITQARPTPPPRTKARPRPAAAAVRRAPLPPRPQHMPRSALGAISAYRAVPLFPEVAPPDVSFDALVRAKLEALATLEVSMASELESGDGKVATEARLTLSALHEDLGHALNGTKPPRYLGPDQATVHAEAAEELADTEFDLALEAAERAAETVDAFGEDPIRELLDDRIAFLTAR